MSECLRCSILSPANVNDALVNATGKWVGWYRNSCGAWKRPRSVRVMGSYVHRRRAEAALAIELYKRTGVSAEMLWLTASQAGSACIRSPYINVVPECYVESYRLDMLETLKVQTWNILKAWSRGWYYKTVWTVPVMVLPAPHTDRVTTVDVEFYERKDGKVLKQHLNDVERGLGTNNQSSWRLSVKMDLRLMWNQIGVCEIKIEWVGQVPYSLCYFLPCDIGFCRKLLSNRACCIYPSSFCCFSRPNRCSRTPTDSRSTSAAMLVQLFG